MLLGVFFSTLAALSWSLVYILSQKVLTQFSAPKFLFFSSIFTFFILSPLILLLSNHKDRFTVHDLKIFYKPEFLILMTVNILADFFILKSVQKIGATTAAILEISYPLFIAVIAFLFLREQITASTAIGGMLIFLGSLIIIYFNPSLKW